MEYLLACRLRWELIPYPNIILIYELLALNFINPEKVSGHKFRRSHAVLVMMTGVNLSTIQKQLGHSDLSVTGIYTRITDLLLKKETMNTTHS